MIANVIRKLSVPAEFCLVILVCFWWGIYGSIRSIVSRPWNNGVVGIFLGFSNHEVIIEDVVSNTPAAAAGLYPNLIIQKIDGVLVDKTNIWVDMNRIRGPAGSKVALELAYPADNQTNIVTLQRASEPIFQSQVTDRTGRFLASVEIVGLLVTFWISRIRNWPLAAWGFKLSWKVAGASVLFYLVTIAVMAPIVVVSKTISPTAGHHHFQSHLSITYLVLLSCLNPFFEETMETCYFVQTLQRYGMWTTVLASAIFRTFLHAYQGIDTVLLIFPIGLLFGFVYWRWRCLWPLFFVHALLDFAALFPH